MQLPLSDPGLIQFFTCRHELAPIPTDYLQPGPSPLSVELYLGSVTQKDARLRGFDLVTSIEL